MGVPIGLELHQLTEPFDFALIELVKLVSVIGLFDLIGLSDLDLIERLCCAARRQPCRGSAVS